MVSALLTMLASSVIAALPAAGAPADNQHSELRTSDPSVAAGSRIINRNSHLCLAARSGSGERPVIQSTCDFDAGTYWPDQYWELERVISGTEIYRIRNTHLNLCIAARGSGEAPAIATTCGQGQQWLDQQWVYIYNSSLPGHKWQNRASGNCLAARGFGESQAIATTCGGWLDQHWRFQ